MQYENDEIPDLSEIDGHWEDRIVEWHGNDPVYLGRRIAILPDRNWLNKPEECIAGICNTTWILDGKVLLCNSCGLDCT